jgi:DNA-binding CsgD family transcriptional regulator
MELSKRELEIARLCAAGKSAPEISAALGCTVSTVKTHLNRVYTKLGISGARAATKLMTVGWLLPKDAA